METADITTLMTSTAGDLGTGVLALLGVTLGIAVSMYVLYFGLDNLAKAFGVSPEAGFIKNGFKYGNKAQYDVFGSVESNRKYRKRQAKLKKKYGGKTQAQLEAMNIPF